MFFKLLPFLRPGHSEKNWYVGIIWCFFLSVLIYYISFWTNLPNRTNRTKKAFVVERISRNLDIVSVSKIKRIFSPGNYVSYCS